VVFVEKFGKQIIVCYFAFMSEIHRQGVIFALFDGYRIQLERRLEDKRGLQGFVIIPGGGIEQGQTEEAALNAEIIQEYAVYPTYYKKLGVVHHCFDGGVNHGNVYLVTNWVGDPANPEKRNEHLEVSLEEARSLCTHPISQRVLDLIDSELSGENGNRI
jgi:8-oxo-dGTP pyrophosphatase MutT (NUDIX family)